MKLPYRQKDPINAGFKGGITIGDGVGVGLKAGLVIVLK
jgi:hypothetical protein